MAQRSNTLTCDILVIGAGIAGCAAAQAAAEAGAQVVVLEKFDQPTAHGLDVGAIGSRLQREQGVSVNPLEAARLIWQWGQGKANYRLIRVFTDRSGEVMDHYLALAEAHGFRTRLNDAMTARSDWDRLDERFRQFRTAHNFLPPGSEGEPDGKTAVVPFVRLLREDAEAHGAEFRFGSKAQRLLRRGGRIIGATTLENRHRLTVLARRGVILAAGGITESKELLKRHCPEALRADLCDYFPAGGDSGEVLRMAQIIGAALTRSGAAPVIHPVHLGPLGPGFQTSWLMVDRSGERCCCEVGFEPSITNARLNAPGNLLWAVWDGRYADRTRQQEPRKAHSLLNGVGVELRQAVERGEYLCGFTLAELARKMRVPADRLAATVARYNAACRSGSDPDFAVPPRFLCPVLEPPFYAARVHAWLLNVPFGLHVDHNSQVLTEEDTPIAGLFAVGNMQGDFFANSYPVTCPGANQGRALTFGCLVGRALAAGYTIDGGNAG